MPRSLSAAFILIMALGVPSCALRKHAPAAPKPVPKPLFAAHTATLDITTGIRVIASVSMPPGFVPNPAATPMWLENGDVIGIFGTDAQGRSAVAGFTGADYETRSLLAVDFGPGAPGGHIVDAAPSPDGLTLATAVAEPTQNRLEVVLRDLIAEGNGHPVASFDGTFDFAQLDWIDNSTIAMALRSRTAPDQTMQAPGSATLSQDGLYLIGLPPAVKRLDRIRCPLSHLVWSTDGRFAASEGDAAARPIVLDTKLQVCVPIGPAAPIEVLSWAPDSSGVLYASAADNGRSTGVYRFSLVNGSNTLFAVSSSAAAYTSSGAVIALGNQQLSWRRVAETPDSPVHAQIASFDPQQSEVKINELGFKTLAPMMARSTMVYSPMLDAAAIGTYLPAGATPQREVLEYVVPTKSAFAMARGPVRGPLIMSWAPAGNVLAIIDGDASLCTLTLLVPPR